MRKTDVDGLILTDRRTLDRLLRDKKLYDLHTVATITDRCVRYLRILCHAEKVAHHKLLGRYYMTPQEVAALLQPVKARTAVVSSTAAAK